MRVTMSLMKRMMMQELRSLHDFDTTVGMVRSQATEAGWSIPIEFPLQEHYVEHGLADMTRAMNLYLCNPQGGCDISRSDAFKPMFVMMPTAVSIYEDSQGGVRVARMRLGTMSMMFAGTVKKTLQAGEARLRKTLEGIVEQ